MFSVQVDTPATESVIVPLTGDPGPAAAPLCDAP
jgi:hypothetical protein